MAHSKQTIVREFILAQPRPYAVDIDALVLLLDVSPTPIRAALADLRAEGLAEGNIFTGRTVLEPAALARELAALDDLRIGLYYADFAPVVAEKLICDRRVVYAALEAAAEAGLVRESGNQYGSGIWRAV
jgi:hypothetical protein